ncbi:hypothetical protein N1015_002032 [Escherichia coli]|nr:hypothetical protein [Escherichia coli]
MSVPNQTPYNIYTANGLTTVFTFEFYIISANDLQVSINGNVVTSGYTVSGVGNKDGGDITFLIPPANGAVVMLERVVPTYRLTDYQDNGDLLADTVNKDFDRIWMAIQRAFIDLGLALTRPLFGGPFNAKGYRIANLADPINDQDAATKNYVNSQGEINFSRTLRVPEKSIPVIPTVEGRKNKILAFNGAGNPIAIPPESGSASDVLIALSSDADGQGDALIAVKQPYPNAKVRTQHDKNAETVSVTDFGAVGDGVTDDAPAIQAALDSGAGTVYFPDGVANRIYCIHSTLRIPSDTNVYIPPSVTVKRGLASVNAMFINSSDGTIGGYEASQNISIYGGGIIDGNESFMSSACTLVCCGHTTNFSVIGMHLLNVGARWHAIEFNSSKKCVARDCYLSSNNEPTNGDGELIQIDNMENTEQFPWFGPYDGTCCNDITIDNCEFRNAGCGIGSHTESTTKKHYNINVNNCKFYTNVYGIKARLWSACKFTNNRIEWGGQGTPIAGIAVYAPTTNITVSDYVITGNTIFNYHNAPYPNEPVEIFRGIWLVGKAGDTSALVRIVIANNEVWETGDHSIAIAYCDDVVVTGNFVGAPDYTSTPRKYSIYSWNSYNVLLCGNSVSGSVAVCAGTLQGQQVSVVGNRILGDLLRINNDANCQVMGNRVSGNDSIGVRGNSNNIEVNVEIPGDEARNIHGIRMATTDGENRGLYDVHTASWLIQKNAYNDILFNDPVVPNRTNALSLGSPALLWSGVYSSSGVITTSDANYKNSIRTLSNVEIEVAKQCAKLIYAFKLNEGVAGRMHIGTIAQHVAEVFINAKLEPENYGLYCYDRWEDGERYAIRYDEFNSFVNAGLSARLDDIEKILLKLSYDN